MIGCARWRRAESRRRRAPASCSRFSRSAAVVLDAAVARRAGAARRSSTSSTRPPPASRGSSRRTSSPPRSRRRSRAASATCSGRSATFLVVLAGLARRHAPRCAHDDPRRLIVARAIQGLGGAIFPLAFGIIRDEFPRERVPGDRADLGLLGIGGALGIVLAGPILAHLDYHWLFWLFLASRPRPCRDWVLVPESPVRAPGRVDWPGAVLLSIWLVCLLVPISEAPTGVGPRRRRSACSSSRCASVPGSTSNGARRARSSTWG